MKLALFLLLSTLAFSCYGKTDEEWRDRVIYQIVTDRFASTDNTAPPCTNFSDYCGGTFKGIEQNLDYIQGMGINAIWISPVIKNAPGGYHGYWHTNFYEINENFGTKQDLKDLIKACHDRDMWVMVDVVPNHVAPVPNNDTFTEIVPFNDKSHYHWPVFLCQDIDKYDPTNQSALEVCWLSYLPDLNHENEFVFNTLIDWVRDLVNTYGMDGLRLDATRHIPKWFWYEFTAAAGVFTVGEVWNHDTVYVGGYQGPIDSLLNFPFHGTLDQAFKNFTNMLVFEKYFQYTINAWPNKYTVVNFLDNHDIPRFLFDTNDLAYYKTAYALTLCSIGIPIIYYGDEQSFKGGFDPQNREPLWGHMNTDSEMYQFFKAINTFRQKTEFYKYEQIQSLADETFYSFVRGQAFFAFTNSPDAQHRVIKTHTYNEGTQLCDILNEKGCVEVKGGVFHITLTRDPKILFPTLIHEDGGKSLWKQLQRAWSTGVVKEFTGSSLLSDSR